MRRLRLVACVAAGAFASVANAQLETVNVTFDDLPGVNGDLLPEPYVEDGFRMSAEFGTWRQGFNFGSPVPSIYANNEGGTNVTAGLEIISDDQRPGMGLFRIALFQANALGTEPGERWILEGFRGGERVINDEGDFANNEWGTYGANHFDMTVDRVLITLIGSTATTGVNLDNIQLQMVPAPGVLALVAGAGLFVTRRRR